jgi:hypothetical protein
MAHAPLSRVRSPLLIALLVLPISVMLVAAMRRQPGTATIVVRPDVQYQLIHGWEAVSQASLYELDPYPHRQEVLDELFDKAVEFGLTRLRLGAPSALEHTRDFATEYAEGRISREEERCGRYSTVNDNDDPNVLEPRGFIWTRSIARCAKPSFRWRAGSRRAASTSGSTSSTRRSPIPSAAATATTTIVRPSTPSSRWPSSSTCATRSASGPIRGS